ncbi:hypothetical protein SDC9_200476 [bioreactor metagenome]|uniref:Uncharacterized protein n=1 Tax=bioreactor metagenome TaxID=1076179 RepID=A0A645J036_9ZZZZ
MDTGGVDDDLGLYLEFFPGLGIPGERADDAAARLEEADNRQVVEAGGTVVDGGAHQRDGQAGIVKLSVPVADAAAQPIRVQAGQGGKQRGPVQPGGSRQAVSAGQPVVEFESGPVEQAVD